MANANETSSATAPAHTAPPWYVGVSECEGVYGGEKHWSVLASGCRGVVADLEGGLSREAKANAEFIVRACNSFTELTTACEELIEMAESVVGNWESGDLARAVQNLGRVADEAKTILEKANENPA